MVKIFKASSQHKTTGQTLELDIDRLDINGLGVAYVKRKPVFVAETLPGEKVKVRVIEHKSKYMKAKLLSVEQASPDRIEAQCRHFKQCGGCDLQHLSAPQQRAFKQQKVSDLFSRENIHDLPWQSAVYDEPWQYRRKARIGVQFNKRGEAIIGFRKKLTNELIPIKSCPVLEPTLSEVFVQLNSLIAQLTQHKAIGHIEVITTNKKVSLIIRQLSQLTAQDQQCWQDAAYRYQWQLFIDSGEQISLLTSGSTEALSYDLNEQLKITFRPDDFIQVNAKVNQKMVRQAVDWLTLSSDDRVLDLFCGLGNFSLAMARQCNKVVGVEGVAAMTEQATRNANDNNIDNCQFYHADLNDDWKDQPWTESSFNKVLLDPARAGAFEACKQVVELMPASILYISCEPASLARDSKLLIAAGYEIEKIALIDMFSQTKHVETMVLFQQN